MPSSAAAREIIGPAGDVPADRGFVPDLEGGQERTAAFAEERGSGPFQRGKEMVKFDDLAGRGDLQAFGCHGNRGPAQSLDIDQSAGLELWFREEPCATGKPCAVEVPILDFFDAFSVGGRW